jgi:hypothetical protein
VSVHGISLKSVVTTTSVSGVKTSTTQINNLGSIAVGDTFLFSACSTKQRNADLGSQGTFPTLYGNKNPYFLFGDAYCITHAIPYYRSALGMGMEQNSASHLLACLKIPRMYELLL